MVVGDRPFGVRFWKRQKRGVVIQKLCGKVRRYGLDAGNFNGYKKT
jgi:hypothetical protein